MTIRLERSGTEGSRDRSSDASDLESLLHPANAFSHPSDVVCDPDLTLNEKRAILASWASDACAVDSAPALRVHPAGRKPISFDEIMDALRLLDEEARAYDKAVPHYRRVLARREKWFGGRRSPNDTNG